MLFFNWKIQLKLFSQLFQINWTSLKYTKYSFQRCCYVYNENCEIIVMCAHMYGTICFNFATIHVFRRNFQCFYKLQFKLSKIYWGRTNTIAKDSTLYVKLFKYMTLDGKNKANDNVYLIFVILLYSDFNCLQEMFNN